MDTTLLPNYPNPIKEQRIQKIPHPNNQMAEFMSDLYGGLRPSPSSFSYLEMDPTMDILRYSNTTSAFHQVPNETNLFLFPQEVVVPLQSQDMSGVVVPEGGGGGGIFQKNNNNSNHDDMKRKRKKNNKPLEFSQGSCSASASANSSVPVKRRKQGSGGGKGKKIIKGDEEVDRGRKEVVHVRARRGQATDSHSLAERVRRGKINERLRFLQDIVPGCYKTMGLAVMLDEIINYVQSLQRQVEFLSMKLTTASSFYDFNSESDLFDTVRRAKAYEAKEIEKIIMRGKLEGHSVTSTTTNNSSNPISTFPPPF